MKRTGLVVAAVVLVVVALYPVLPLSMSTRSLRASVERVEAGGFRATIVNDGYLPVFVGGCNTVSDEMHRDIRVGDALQRWRVEGGVWDTVVHRNRCEVVPLGTVEATFTRNLLWPRQRLHTTEFYPNVGFPGAPFQHGDKIRFLVFTRMHQKDVEALTSPEFHIE